MLILLAAPGIGFFTESLGGEMNDQISYVPSFIIETTVFGPQLSIFHKKGGR